MPGRTGPRTPEGKAKSRLNGLKHGRYMNPKTIMSLGDKAGTLMMCVPCGKKQQAACNAAESCALQDEMLLAYTKAAFENDLSKLQEVNVMQLATMDLVFTQKLRWATENLGEFDEVSVKGGGIAKVPVVTQEHIYELMNMMRTLGKTPMDMQITKSTQEAINVEWAKLLEADIDAARAEENKARILAMMNDYRNNLDQSKKLEALDADIAAFVQQEEKEKEMAPKQLESGKVKRNPFGNNG